MSVDIVELNTGRYAVIGLMGTLDRGCGPTLCETLRVCARAHTIVDLRQTARLTPEAVKALLWALGSALDRGRTVRVVVRDDRQRHYLMGLGLNGLMPMHDSLGEATDAVEATIRAAAGR